MKGTLTGAYFLFWGTGFFFGPFLMGQADKWLGSGKGFMIFSFCLFLQNIAIITVSGYKHDTESGIKLKGRI